MCSDDMLNESVAEVSESETSRAPGDKAPAADRHGKKATIRILCTVCISLVTAAVITALLTHFLFPVMRIHGSAMGATLFDGDVVIVQKTSAPERGDICIFEHGGETLCSRVIGLEGDVIEISSDGMVFVGGEELYEPYLQARTLGECDIEFPYTVPDGSYFLLADSRRSSADSRNADFGCIPKEDIVGKVRLRIWPIPGFGAVD